ncbi:hypothetical protein EBR57_03165 [bacterium]|nr:hypothetical protein [bacterium]
MENELTTYEELRDHLHDLSLDGSWPVSGDVQYGDGHATLLINPIDLPEWKGKSFILAEDNYGFKDVLIFDNEKDAQSAFDNWDTGESGDENDY